MKKLMFLFLGFSFLCLSVYGQGGHLKFSGMPVDGERAVVDTELNAMGYVRNIFNSNLYSGKFAGKDVSVSTYYDEVDGYLYEVAVFFKLNSDFSWDEAVRIYRDIKGLLSRKYNGYSLIYNRGLVKPSGGMEGGPVNGVTGKYGYRVSGGTVVLSVDWGYVSFEMYYTAMEMLGELSELAMAMTGGYQPYTYNVKLEYIDRINSGKHNRRLQAEKERQQQNALKDL